MKNFWVGFSLLCTLLAGCVAPPTSRLLTTKSLSMLSDKEIQTLLVGTWYGKGIEESGDIYEFISRRGSDGIYTVTYRVSKANEILDEAEETGYWRVNAGYYETTLRVTQDESGSLTPIFEFGPFRGFRYKIVALSNDLFEYEEINLGMPFKATRVPQDYKFPPIEGASGVRVERNSSAASGVETPDAAPSFDDEARDYVNTVGAEFVEFFEHFCSRTNLSLDAIIDQADALEWRRVNQAARPNEYHWMSPGFDIVHQAGRPPFILEFLPEHQNRPDSARMCSLSMFGTSAEPAVGRKEVEILTDILAARYDVGEVAQTSTGSLSSAKSYVPDFIQYRAELKKKDDRDLLYGYRWAGGEHRLFASTTGQGRR